MQEFMNAPPLNQENGWSYENSIEKELSVEEYDNEDISEHFKALLVDDNYDISGQWDSKYWHDGVHLTIKPRSDGKYAVIYYARGDLARWTLMRIASFKDGVLTFEKAVKEYAPVMPYTRFYLLKSPNGIRFVSQIDGRCV